MTEHPFVFQWGIAITLILWTFLDPESVINLGARIDGYLTLGFKWLAIAPAYVRMIVLQRYMLWKMRRQFKTTFPTNKF